MQSNLQQQRGAGLLEILLALAISIAIVIAGINYYRSYKVTADAQMVQQTVQTIQAAGSAYYLSNCSDQSLLELNKWQPLSLISDYLPGGTTMDNPLGAPYSSGDYYQIEFYQLANSNVIFCVQAQISDVASIAQYAQLLGAVSAGIKSKGVEAASAVTCTPAVNSIAWQSLPSVAPANFMNEQVVERLKAFRNQNNTSGSTGCKS